MLLRPTPLHMDHLLYYPFTVTGCGIDHLRPTDLWRGCSSLVPAVPRAVACDVEPLSPTDLSPCGQEMLLPGDGCPMRQGPPIPTPLLPLCIPHAVLNLHVSCDIDRWLGWDDVSTRPWEFMNGEPHFVDGRWYLRCGSIGCPTHSAAVELCRHLPLFISNAETAIPDKPSHSRFEIVGGRQCVTRLRMSPQHPLGSLALIKSLPQLSVLICGKTSVRLEQFAELRSLRFLELGGFLLGYDEQDDPELTALYGRLSAHDTTTGVSSQLRTFVLCSCELDGVSVRALDDLPRLFPQLTSLSLPVPFRKPLSALRSLSTLAVSLTSSTIVDISSLPKLTRLRWRSSLVYGYDWDDSFHILSSHAVAPRVRELLVDGWVQPNGLSNLLQCLPALETLTCEPSVCDNIDQSVKAAHPKVTFQTFDLSHEGELTIRRADPNEHSRETTPPAPHVQAQAHGFDSDDHDEIDIPPQGVCTSAYPKVEIGVANDGDYGFEDTSSGRESIRTADVADALVEAASGSDDNDDAAFWDSLE